MLESGDYRWSALHRYHDAALEGAIMLTAFGRLQIASHADSPYLTGPRLGVQIMTRMHDFALNARKAIEIANINAPGLITKIRAGRFTSQTVQLSNGLAAIIPNRDFLWIVSRIIHSQKTGIGFVRISESYSGKARVHHVNQPRYFLFRSDFDASGSSHCVETEGLVSSYANSWLAHEIGEVIRNG